MDAAWRMVWALPLVVVIGTLAVLVLRRFVAPSRPAADNAKRMSVRESLSLSDETRVHLLEIDGKGYLVVESAHPGVLQAPLHANDASFAPKPGPPWLRRMCGSRAP